eukprot:jgi/Mesvir1/3082/Mv26185-RA.1
MRILVPITILALFCLIGLQLAAGDEDSSDMTEGSLAVSKCTFFEDLGPDDGIRVDGEARLDALLESTSPVDKDHPEHSPLQFNGTTSGYMSVKFVGSSGAAIPAGAIFKAHVHASSCDSGTLPGGDHYKQNASITTEVVDNELWFTLTVGADGRASASVDRGWFADYDKTMSVVIHDSSDVTGSTLEGRNSLRGGHNRIACCDLVPPLPSLPDSWSVSIEANILARGYTVEREEVYDSERSTLVLRDTTHRASFTDISNFNTMRRRTVYAGNHTCTSKEIDSRTLSMFGQNSTHGQFRMFSTAEYLRFASGNETYVPGTFLVRGVPCEKWALTNVTDKEGTLTYTAQYYFTEDNWNEPVFSFHRSLRRVEVEGRFLKGPRAGSTFHNVYDFTGLRPFVVDEDEVTNPCRAYGGGIEGCGCSGSNRDESWDAKPGEIAAIIIFLSLITGTVLLCLYLKKRTPAAMKKYENEAYSQDNINSSNSAL